MDIIKDIKLCAKENIKRIVLPESMDERVVLAAIKARDEGIAKIILIADEIKFDYDLKNIQVISPATSSLTDELVNSFYELRKDKVVTLEKAREILLSDYMYYACMLVYLDYADGVVSGACHSSSDTLRPALQIIKTKEDVNLVSSFFLMDIPDSTYGDEGVLVFSDAGLVQNPNSNELSMIAYSASKSFESLVGSEAKVAFLSHSTYGSAQHNDVDKVKKAVTLAKLKYPDMVCDGELQLDAAIDMSVAKMKCPDSKVAGHANTLIFPDLDAGNIGYKLVERFAHAKAYGPLTQGINKPVNDLSRGCDVDTIVGVIAITSVQANN